MKNQFKSKNGITLIALVITIIVLLILAGITILALSGENGILTRTGESKDRTRRESIQEQINLWKTERVLESIKNDSTTREISDLVAELETNGLITSEERAIIESTHQLTIGNQEPIIFPYGEDSEENGIYSIEGLEDSIASADLFDYEIIDTAEVSATTLDTLPTKEVAITRIKPKYCNGQGYNPDTGEYGGFDYSDTSSSSSSSSSSSGSGSGISGDTNYEVIYAGEKISDLLVIPYQVELNGEMYKVTKCNLFVAGTTDGLNVGYMMPKIKTIIYPNTVTEIEGKEYFYRSENINNITENIILPENLKVIGNYAFNGCASLTNIEIPESVTSIGDYAFKYCSNLTSITIPEVVTSIGDGAFFSCSNLTSITIPKSVTSIGSYAFNSCSNLTTINYTGTKEQWNNITIDDGNDILKSTTVTINYNYTE